MSPTAPAGLRDVEHRAPEFGPPAETIAQFRIRGQPLHGLGKKAGFARWDKDGVDPVLQDLGDAADP